MSSTESVHATQTPAAVRLYFAHERAILGTLMVLLVLLAWEGLERGLRHGRGGFFAGDVGC